MVRWKRLKRLPVYTAFAWTQIGRYGKWRLFCSDTLVILESASIHFWDLKSKTTWQAVGVWVFYGGRIKLTVVDAEDLGMIHLLGVNVTGAAHGAVEIYITPAFIISLTTFLIQRGVALSLMGQQPLSLMVRVIKLQWPRLKRSSSKTSVGYTPSWRHWCKGGNSSHTEAVWEMKSVYGVMLKFWPNDVTFLVP